MASYTWAMCAIRIWRRSTREHAPWYILRSDDKKRARLNCLDHVLKLIPHEEVEREKVKLPKRSMKGAYDDEASLKGHKFVPEQC